MYHESNKNHRLHTEIIFGTNGNFTIIPEHIVHWNDGASDGIWIIDFMDEKLEIQILDHDPEINALEDIVTALERQNVLLTKFFDHVWKQGYTAGRDSCTG